jgi:hypothetical protein
MKAPEDRMPTLLKAQQQLEVAMATLKRTTTAATIALVARAHDDMIEALAEHPNMTAQLADAIKAKVIHREKYEKVTTETPDKSERAAASEQESEPPPTEDSARGEDAPVSEEAKGPKGKPPKMGGASARTETSDESALRLAYKDASGKYARSLRGAGIDAYGVKFGPDALLRACEKAFAVGTIGEVFGALASLPEQRANATAIEQRLAKLEGARVTDEIEALVIKAKAQGRTKGAEDRKDLRAFGREFGAKALQRRIADRPAKRTDAQGYREPPDNADGNRGTVDAEMSAEQVAESHERVTRGMTAEEKAVYLEEFNRLAAKKRATAPAV